MIIGNIVCSIDVNDDSIWLLLSIYKGIGVTGEVYIDELNFNGDQI